ncbi:hypothetical protein KI387_008575, partial [Taxus chinensis]
MANIIHLTSALCVCYCIASSAFVADAGSLNFTFPPDNNFNKASDAVSGGDGHIELTRNGPYSMGWVTYNQSIPLWNSSSRALANFSTHFQFTLGPGNLPTGYGDGLAFFMAPFQLEQPLGAAGGWLGLFNRTSYYGSTYPMIAVEFDTYRNDWDPDDNHVGININSIFSMVYVSLSNQTEPRRPSGEDLKNWENWEAWVDYNGGAMQLQVFLLSNPSGNVNNISKPKNPICSYDIDLRDHLPETIKVGLSASTGNSTETHTIYAWNFSSEYSWESDGNQNSSSVKVILISVFSSFLTVCGFVFGAARWYSGKRKNKLGGDAKEESDSELDELCAQGPR